MIVIKSNAHKYPVRFMCKMLEISTSGYYKYKTKQPEIDPEIQRVVRIFNDNQKAYGTRRIQKECRREGVIISRRRIARIMHAEGLISTYTLAHYKVHKTIVNEDTVVNEVNRQFDGRDIYEVLVSDLTYVRVDGSWNYICMILDLHSREIVGYSCGTNKNALLVMKAFSRIKKNLSDVQYFHTDRGNELKNRLIDEVLGVFDIKRSLSNKGTPYDNVVSEATFKAIKTEFVYQNSFKSLDELRSNYRLMFGGLIIKDYTQLLDIFHLLSPETITSYKKCPLKC